MSDEFAAKYVPEKQASALWADWEERLDAARKKRAKALGDQGEPKPPMRPKPWEIEPDPREMSRRRAVKSARQAIEKAQKWSASKPDPHPIIPGVSRERVIQAFADRGEARGDPRKSAREPERNAPKAVVPTVAKTLTVEEVIRGAAPDKQAETGRRSALGTAALIAVGLFAGAAIGFAGTLYLSRANVLPTAAPEIPVRIEADATLSSAQRLAVRPEEPVGVGELGLAGETSIAAAPAQSPRPALAQTAPERDGPAIATEATLRPARPAVENVPVPMTVPSLSAGPSQAGAAGTSDTQIPEMNAPMPLQAVRAVPDADPAPAAPLGAVPVPLPQPESLSAPDGPIAGGIDAAFDLPAHRQVASPASPFQPQTETAFSCDTCVSPAPNGSGARIELHVGNVPDEAALVGTLVALESAGFDSVKATPEDLTVQMSQVRFFHARDERAARAVAEMTGSEVLDLSWFRPQPEEGLIEVWLSDQSLEPESIE